MTVPQYNILFPYMFGEKEYGFVFAQPIRIWQVSLRNGRSRSLHWDGIGLRFLDCFICWDMLSYFEKKTSFGGIII